MTSCHLIRMWHAWNTNANDIMMTWFTIFANLVRHHIWHVHHVCACMHGTCALDILPCLVCLSGLACTQANSDLENALGTKYQMHAKHVNENLMDCNENLVWDRMRTPGSSLARSSGTQQKVRKQ